MTDDKFSDDIDTIKKLLILQLLMSGTPAELIAKATGMNPNSIRNMFPLRKYKKSD